MAERRCPSKETSSPSTDEVGETREVDAATGLDGLRGERRGETALACFGRTEEVDHLVAADKIELGKRKNAVAVVGWNVKSKPASLLMVDSLATRSAIFTRRFSRCAIRAS